MAVKSLAGLNNIPTLCENGSQVYCCSSSKQRMLPTYRRLTGFNIGLSEMLGSFGYLWCDSQEAQLLWVVVAEECFQRTAVHLKPHDILQHDEDERFDTILKTMLTE